MEKIDLLDVNDEIGPNTETKTMEIKKNIPKQIR